MTKTDIITPDILELYGFIIINKYSNWYAFMESDNADFLSIEYFRNYTIQFRDLRHCRFSVHNIKYLSELKSLYKLLSGNDLTIKIIQKTN